VDVWPTVQCGPVQLGWAGHVLRSKSSKIFWLDWFESLVACAGWLLQPRERMLLLRRSPAAICRRLSLPIKAVRAGGIANNRVGRER
jgi:hypothetical protein